MVAALLVAVLTVAACTGGGDRSAERATTTTSTAAALRCPDGSTVPDAPAAREVSVPVPTPQGPDGREGALDLATLLPRTGDLTFLSAAALAGVELAVQDLDAAGGVLGAPVGLRHGDSAEGTPGTAEAEVAALLAGGADVVVGPLSSATAARVLEQVTAGGALLVSPASTSSGLDALDRAGRLFRTGPTEALQGRALADLVLADGHRTVSVAARADEYGQVIADALAARLAERGASVTARVDHDPSSPTLGDDVVAGLDTTADAIVVVGLAESALILDALVDAGEAPLDRAVYGTDGNLGERLGDLVADPEDLACLRGLLPVHQPEAAFADRVRDHAGLAGVDDGPLDLAAESYDAAVVAALAAEAAASDQPEAVAAAMAGVTSAGTPCRTPQDCLDLIRQGVDVSYAGETGRLALGADGNRTDAGFTVVAFDVDGHLARLGSRRARA